MSQQVQELIDKIKTEGVESAQKSADEIIAKARKEAAQIVEGAKRDAQQIVSQGEQQVQKFQESARMAVAQAARDTLLSLRKEIERTLKSIIKEEVKSSLSAEQMGAILEVVVKSAVSQGIIEGDVVIDLNASDTKKLKDGVLARLQKQVKQEIRLHSSGDVTQGFSISFDSGKSSFDFTDQSLADYLSSFLNTQISELVKESVKK